MPRHTEALFAFVIAVALTSCARVTDSKATIDQQTWAALSQSQKQDWLRSVSRECRLPESFAILQGHGEVRLQPRPDESYEAVDCGLRRLRPLMGFMNFGFVGNEAYTNEVN